MFNGGLIPDAFADPVAPWDGGPNQGFGNAAKDAVKGPGIQNWNISLFKSIAFTSNERVAYRLALRVVQHLQPRQPARRQPEQP